MLGRAGGCVEVVYTHGAAFVDGFGVGAVVGVSDEFGVSEVFGGEEDLGGDFEYCEGLESVGEVVRGADWVV